jgi:endonuclease/exonuclease/phosphatase family metal-dependent hydrolase
MKTGRILLVACTLLLVPALLLSYASMYVHPDRFWPAVFFGLAYIIVLTGNVLLAIAWYFASRKVFLFMLLLLLAGLPAHLSTFSFGSKRPPAADGREIRMVTYNVKGFDFTSEKPERDAIMDALAYCEADILCLLEFNSYHDHPKEPSNIDRVMKETGLPYLHYYKAYENRKATRSYGVAIFSRYPIIGKGRLDYPSLSKMNTTIWADIDLGYDTIRVYSSHLQSNQLTHSDFEFIGKTEVGDTLGFDSRRVAGKFRRSYTLRAGQADSIRASLELSPHPVVVVGDFNDTPVSYTYRTIRRDMDDAFLQAGKGIGATYIPFPFIRIDYILYSPELWRARSYDRIRVKGSDHYMVKSVLEWKNP